MKKLVLLFVSVFSLMSCNEILDSSLTNEEIIGGLKEALRVGTDTSVSQLNATDGYFKDQAVKILLPDEFQIINNNLNTVASYIPGGQAALQGQIDDLVLKLNRSAEDAASEAKPIFVDAITNISISDGLEILQGSDTAATHYLKQNTYSPLFDLFQPKVNTSLSKPIIGNISAENSYSTIVNTYNTAADAYNLAGIITGKSVKKVTDNSLSSYTTNKALTGLFFKVSEEEKDIRRDPIARVNEILKRVFGSPEANQ